MTDPTLPSEYAVWSARLRNAEREADLLRAIVDCVPVMLYQWVLSPAGEARFTLVNRGSELIHGTPPAQLLSDDMPGLQLAVAASAEHLTPFA